MFSVDEYGEQFQLQMDEEESSTSSYVWIQETKTDGQYSDWTHVRSGMSFVLLFLHIIDGVDC